jgi:hypothetical protein
MLTAWMYINYELIVMATKYCREGNGMATARAKMPTSVISRHLSLDPDCVKGFSSELICGLIRI